MLPSLTRPQSALWRPAYVSLLAIPVFPGLPVSMSTRCSTWKNAAHPLPKYSDPRKPNREFDASNLVIVPKDSPVGGPVSVLTPEPGALGPVIRAKFISGYSRP